MAALTYQEKALFLELFNRGGYVLDFSTSQFDIFTLHTVGVQLCQKYRLSKGKSLEQYVYEASDNSVKKLYLALLDHYEAHYGEEINNDTKYSSIYQKCKQYAARWDNQNGYFSEQADKLKEEFSNDYIDGEIELMRQLVDDNPTEAIGKAKELIEICCKTILDKKKVEYKLSDSPTHLVKATEKVLRITPEDIPDTIPEVNAIKGILSSLSSIASNMAQLRNAYGSGHGKSASYKGLNPRHAHLAVGASITLVKFLWDSYTESLK